MKPPTYTPTLLVATCLIVIATLYGVVGIETSPSARAESLDETSTLDATPAAARQGVERWHGIITLDRTASIYASCPWVCPGNSHYGDQQEWYLEVDAEGVVTGYIRTQVTAYSYSQTETNIMCGPVAETNYIYENCTYAGQLTQPNSIVMLQGVREVEQFSQRPILKITDASQTQKCEAAWTARGIHSETGISVHLEETDDCTRYFHTPQTFYITTFDDGRAPIIDLNYNSSDSGGGSVRMGQLVATTEEPFLELDRELLERSIFLDQVAIEEQFTANLNWNSPDGGWVTWQLSDAEPERIGPTEEDALPKPLNNGTQGPGQKQLTVQAQSTLKQTSSPQVTQITVAPFPAWVSSPQEVIGAKVDGAASYKSTRKFPEPAFTGDVNVPKLVPFLGGKTLGLKETQGSLAWEALSTSEGQGSISGQTGFLAMGKEVIGSLGGHARIVLDKTGLHIPEGGIDFGIGGTIASEPEPLLGVVPSLRPALAAIEAVSPQAAAYITERANAKLELQPKLDFSFNFLTQNDEIKFKNAEAKPSFGFKTIAELNLIKDILHASASIGGAIGVTFQVPEPYFKEAMLQGLAQAQIVFMDWAREGEKAWSVTISGASTALTDAAEQLAVNADSGRWERLPRDYVNLPNYARWHGGESEDETDAPDTDRQTADVLMQENVYPLANPSLYVRTNSSGTQQGIQAWVHDNPASPITSRGDIYISRGYIDRNFNTRYTSWQTPELMSPANDNQQDLAPQAAYINNQILVVWQRMDTATPPDFNDDPADYLSHWQIVSQRRGGDSDLEILSAPGSLHYRHQLGALDDGALVVWLNNPANQVLGDTTNPDDILFARYTLIGDSWSVAAPALADVAGLLSFDLATNGSAAALVYARDMDNNLETVADLELFYLTWNGTIWSAPTRLTNNSVADEYPEVVIDASGAPLLVWQQAGTLKFLDGGWDNTPTDLPLPNAATRPDYELTRSSDGKLALVWQQAGAEDTRIAYAIYDAAHSTWSGELTLPLPKGAEGSMATAMAAGFVPEDTDDEDGKTHDGGLIVAYQLAHVEVLTRTVNNVETEAGIQNNVNIPNTVQIAQHDLRVATVPLARNLSVTPSDLTLPASNKLQAVIHNSGELVVENAPLVLELGPPDPVSGQSATVAKTIPFIAAGTTATVTFTIADPQESMFTVAIDPERTLGESDYTDNRAAVGTDLAISLLPAVYNPLGTDVRAAVTQQGQRYVSLLALAKLTLNSPDGVVIGRGQVAFPLAATDSVTLSAPVSTTLLGPGRHQLYWTLAPDDTLGESDRSNNTVGTTITILPDLAAMDDTIFFGKGSGNSAPFNMRVMNQGNWPNEPTNVKVFDAMPGTATSQTLLSLAVPAIEPGMSVVISGTLNLVGMPAASSGLSSVYVQIDGDEAVEESNENNNLIAAGDVLEVGAAVSFPLYMPAIER